MPSGSVTKKPKYLTLEEKVKVQQAYDKNPNKSFIGKLFNVTEGYVRKMIEDRNINLWTLKSCLIIVPMSPL